jgi:rhamnose utilization protein RhaD (predicted bifunctional aldolase and dehydrogenase)/NAD(P)-dependent dehydrogenase (short-subunit alcohol dehydrogenase family)
MDSKWSQSDLEELKSRDALRGINNDISLSVYCTRLIGGDPHLVLHGGGNASVKTVQKDLFGNEVEVLCIKGSGWDMGEILPAGLPPVKLAPLRRLKSLESLSDEEMVSYVRSNLLDSASPTPSVETLSHAFLPHKFINHSHASAILSITNQPNGEDLCREIFGSTMGIVPYIMPGFGLAKNVSEVFEENPEVGGLILLNHGIFTFSDDAETSYRHMIDAISTVENRMGNGNKHVFVPATIPPKLQSLSSVALIIRGVCISQDERLGKGTNASQNKLILEFRSSDQILEFVNGKEVDRYSQGGVATPDHVIRTKNWPLVLPFPEATGTGDFRKRTEQLTKEFQHRYNSYFQRQVDSRKLQKTKLDSTPRVVLVPGHGLFGIGRDRKEAMISADIAESFVQTITNAESIGEYKTLGEADVFDVEYWSLEQSKLSNASTQPLLGNVVAITGGGGTIGTAIANEFNKLGAQIALLDLNFPEEDHRFLQLECDVTEQASVKSAFETICEHYGGLDIVVSNAGAMHLGSMESVSDETLRESFEINFFAHQTVMQYAVEVMKLQNVGGNLLFNVSKQAVNPGVDAGPYGLPKAATLALMRQYALETGKYGIRANAVNADRIQSGLLTKEMISTRAQARGLDEAEYLAGNILGKEVTAEDVARAFTQLALSESTVANVTTVDGGNIAAALR